MDKLKTIWVRTLASKWLIPICIVILSIFFEYANANAVYYPLECSDHYSGYCSEGADCYDQFGDDGLDWENFCFNAPNYPFDFADETTALETIADQLEKILSGNIFAWNVMGFWLPFSVILNFCLTTLLAIMFKLGYFRKK